MPAASSIYWNSLDSQRSSGESSGEGFSANRHYVDPWDLENYAYLRRHSVVAPIYQRARSCVGGPSRLSHRAQTEPDYWYYMIYNREQKKFENVTINLLSNMQICKSF